MYGQNPNDAMVDSSVMRTGPIKIYERGPDDKKIKGGGWHFEDLDRVRLEVSPENCYKEETGNYYLRKNCILSLQDLIKDPKFRKIFPGKIKFRKFPDSSTKLPREWDDYKIKDESGISDCFHEEYLHGRETCDLENIRQCMEPVEGFKELEDKILYMARQFDDNWKKDSE
jgi:hypothetical protein